jgi:glutamine cyclotransferase
MRHPVYLVGISIEHILYQDVRNHEQKKTSYTNGLPDDEHKMLETCGRHQELE